MTLKVKLEGIDHIRTVLRELPKAAEKRAVREAMIESADVFANDAAARAPVDDGALRDSIVRTWRIIKSQERGTRKPGKDGARAFVGPNYSRTAAASKGYAPHAHLVEYGTGPRYTLGRKSKPKGVYSGEGPPKPFMRPAFDSQKGQFISDFTGVLLERINKAVARLRKKQAKGKR